MGATGAADAKFSRPSPTVVVWPKDGGQEKAKKVEGEVEEVEEVEEVRNGWLPLKPGSLPENGEFSERWYAELGTQFKHLPFACTQEHLTQRRLLLHEQHRAGLGGIGRQFQRAQVNCNVIPRTLNLAKRELKQELKNPKLPVPVQIQ